MRSASRYCLLKVPPFHRRLPIIANPADGTPVGGVMDATELTRRIVTGRIGGTFWAAAPSCIRPVIVCSGYETGPASMRVLACLLERLARVFARSDLMLVAPGAYGSAARVARRLGIAHIHAAVDPHVLLDHAGEIHELGQGDIGDLAALRGITVTRYASPDRGHPVDGVRTARQLIDGWRYHDPYTGQPTDIGQILALQVLWRRTIDANRQIGACVGMSLWKRQRIADFFAVPPSHPPFIRRGRDAVRRCARQGKAIVAWATRIPDDLLPAAFGAQVPVWRVEDGFIRSVGLGSGLQVPASIFVDQRGIYYDPSAPSDLEHILATTSFDTRLKARARDLIDHVINNGISKYGRSEERRHSDWNAGERRVLLVPGQVSDDLSVIRGGGAIKGNLQLLQAVRQHNPDAFIIYRPHPDVVAGYRAGSLSPDIVMEYADHISIGGAITDLIWQVHEIHTLTSLAGFEGLMRQRKVVTYGCPFYAGWGLTTDLGCVPATRRGRSLLLEELVAAALILYPRYMDPLTHIPCEVETIIARFGDDRAWKPTSLMRLKMLQGKIKHKMSRCRQDKT